MIADHTAHELVVVSGEANIASIDGLRKMVQKTKVEITNFGWFENNIKVTEKSCIVFDDEVLHDRFEYKIFTLNIINVVGTQNLNLLSVAEFASI